MGAKWFIRMNICMPYFVLKFHYKYTSCIIKYFYICIYQVAGSGHVSYDFDESSVWLFITVHVHS